MQSILFLKGKINAQNASLASQKVKNLTAEEPKSLRAAELDQVTNILEELAVFAANEKVRFSGQGLKDLILKFRF